jgi:hypothetical protein
VAVGDDDNLFFLLFCCCFADTTTSCSVPKMRTTNRRTVVVGKDPIRRPRSHSFDTDVDGNNVSLIELSYVDLLGVDYQKSEYNSKTTNRSLILLFVTLLFSKLTAARNSWLTKLSLFYFLDTAVCVAGFVYVQDIRQDSDMGETEK